MTEAEPSARDYFRRDQASGVSPPDLTKPCTFADHIVHARGKRTCYTSVTLDLRKVRDFGDTNYKLNRDAIDADRHALVEHEDLIKELRRVATEEAKEDRLRAIQALRYATARKEGLVDWKFDISRWPRKDVISVAEGLIQKYFTQV